MPRVTRSTLAVSPTWIQVAILTFVVGFGILGYLEPASVVGAENIVPLGFLNLAGEDFAHYMERIPGCFLRIGAREPGGAVGETRPTRAAIRSVGARADSSRAGSGFSLPVTANGTAALTGVGVNRNALLPFEYFGCVTAK